MPLRSVVTPMQPSALAGREAELNLMIRLTAAHLVNVDDPHDGHSSAVTKERARARNDQ